MPRRPPPIRDRILLHTATDEHHLIDPADVYWVDAHEDGSLLRLHGRHRHRDTRTLTELQPVLSPHGFIRVHQSHLVNIRRILLLRRRTERDWELKLEPPVNRVLPVSRAGMAALRAALGDG